MPLFAIPIVLMIEANSLEDATQSVDDWHDNLDIDEQLPSGTEEVDITPQVENNDEGQRILFLPPLEEDIEDYEQDKNDEKDDFFEPT